MSAAFVAACEALHLKVGDDPATRFVAEKVIEFTQRGIRDPNMLRKLTLQEFDVTDGSLPPPIKSHRFEVTFGLTDTRTKDFSRCSLRHVTTTVRSARC
jgi:hypothetical protein